MSDWTVMKPASNHGRREMNEITLTKEVLKDIVEEAYEAGFNAGCSARHDEIADALERIGDNET
jgi:hypothetical protein